MTPKFIQYPKCTTCKKASKWLSDNSIEVESVNIVEQNPSKEEITSWVAMSAKPVRKFFNTSGLRYKALSLKDIVGVAPEAELIEILSSDGMLVKRPVLVTDTHVLVGFNQAEWESTLLK